jgi:phenolic acid decarboxylase
MAHQSLFSLRTHGGVCAGEQWVYDGDLPIARLRSACVEQPEQNLRYFDRNLKPVELRDLRLRPGGVGTTWLDDLEVEVFSAG